MQREECLDMDGGTAAADAAAAKLHNSATDAAVRRDDHLRSFIQQEFGKQADLLQELSSQIRSAVEGGVAQRGHVREFSFAHRPSPSAKKAPKAAGDDPRLDDSDTHAKTSAEGKREHHKDHNKFYEPGGISKELQDLSLIRCSSMLGFACFVLPPSLRPEPSSRSWLPS